jgi:hypothetical protein
MAPTCGRGGHGGPPLPAAIDVCSGRHAASYGAGLVLAPAVFRRSNVTRRRTGGPRARPGRISPLSRHALSWTYVSRLCYEPAMGFQAPKRFNIVAVLALLTFGCAGRPTGPGETIGRSSDLGTNATMLDAGDASAAAPVAMSGGIHFDAGVADPSRLLTDADRDQVIAPGSAGPLGASGLVLHVAERGPGRPWIIAVSNDGNAPTVLVADTRLLWLDVTVPGAKKSTQCRLPVDLLPKEAEPRLNITLMPGESVAQLIDPRLYCFAASEQKQLVPGARVVPHLGWPELPNKTTWVHGKKSNAPVPQPPPFIAHHADLDVELAVDARNTALKVAKSVRLPKGASRPSNAALGVPLPSGVDKQLQGPELSLRDTYAEWSSPKTKDARENAEDAPLELKLIQGSDARTEHNATVQITLRNQSRKRQVVYFRREFVTFEVIGPAGVRICDPTPDVRAPDREAFVTLAPGATRSFSSRLAELCPRDTFDMPGLYLVNGTYEATEPGAKWNLAAFTGSVTSARPANVRIRIGELSILHKVVLNKMDDGRAGSAANLQTADAGTTAPAAPSR